MKTRKEMNKKAEGLLKELQHTKRSDGVSGEHTPTPWYLQRYPDEKSVEIKANRGYALIANVYWNEGEVEANAAFIVRAVNSHEELLTLLKLMLEENQETGYKYQALKAMARAGGK